RGFWPGLCVSLKHNSKFANYTILAKGDYDYELNISIPFSLVSIDKNSNDLVIMPGYWMLYNMYALQRNSYKYINRDHRYEKLQHIEYDYLAPDTVNEMFTSLLLFEQCVGKAYALHYPEKEISEKEHVVIGRNLLSEKQDIISD